MTNITFQAGAWEEYLEWQETDKKIFKRINALIKDIQRNGLMAGIGKPEALKNVKAWSHRIDDYHRLVYTADESQNLPACRQTGGFSRAGGIMTSRLWKV